MRGDSYVFFGLGQREQETYQRCPGDSPDQLCGVDSRVVQASDGQPPSDGI
jgi:phycoerythrin-associated linker protein